MGGVPVTEDGHFGRFDGDWLSRLTPVEKALLDRLASGATIAAAAMAEFLSLRTANRRIADLRRKAGVDTTRELVGLYRSSR